MSKKKDYESDKIWKTLSQDYPEEIKQIHQMQLKDMQLYGKIQHSTNLIMEEFLDTVVEDNQRRRNYK